MKLKWNALNTKGTQTDLMVVGPGPRTGLSIVWLRKKDNIWHLFDRKNNQSWATAVQLPDDLDTARLPERKLPGPYLIFHARGCIASGLDTLEEAQAVGMLWAEANLMPGKPEDDNDEGGEA